MTFAYKHGYGVKDPIYRSWLMMKNRCLNPNSVDFKNYAARGIYVCDEWMDFRNFLRDMAPRPDGMTLERIDNDGPYCKANCKWATRREQNVNSRNCHYVTFNGVTMTLTDACRKQNLPYDRVRRRLKLGWSLEQALELKRDVSRETLSTARP